MKVLVLNQESFAVDENDFTIDRSAVDVDMCRLPSRMLFYGELEARFRLAVESKDTEIKKLEADLDTFIRANKGDKKKTETQIAYEVLQEESYQKAKRELADLSFGHNKARWIMNALSAKRDCLIALSYTDRQIAKMDRYQ